MAERILHVCLSVRGALDWPLSRLKRVVRNQETGEYLSPFQARQWPMDHLAQGHEVVPMCSCEGFDFKTGCPGKEIAK